MSKHRFNHVEPSEAGSTPEKKSFLAKLLFRRKLEKSSGGSGGILSKLGFRRKLEKPGMDREKDPPEPEKPLEMEEPPPVKAEQPSLPRTRAETRAQSDPDRFSKTRSELEALAGDLHKTPSTDRGLPRIRVEADPVARKQREAADRFYKDEIEPSVNQHPSVGNALGKILLGGGVLFLFIFPLLPSRFLNSLPPGLLVPLGIASAALFSYMRFSGRRRRW